MNKSNNVAELVDALKVAINLLDVVLRNHGDCLNCKWEEDEGRPDHHPNCDILLLYEAVAKVERRNQTAN